MDSTKRDHLRQFPIKKLESLIKLAVENNLSLLEIGDVKIVPSHTRPTSSIELATVAEAEKKLGRRLTDQEKQDEILFGPGGHAQVADELNE